MPDLLRSLLCFVILSLSACGAPPQPALTLPSVPKPHDAAALEAAAEAYYIAPDVAGLIAAVDAAKKAGLHSALYHELAADLTALQARPSVTYEHLYQALLDPSAATPVALLSRLVGRSWTLDERDRLERLVTALRTQHPNAELRAFAAWVEAHARHLRGDDLGRTEALAAVSGRLPLTLVGPFDNDQGKGFDAEQPPERAVDLSAGYPTPRGEVRWRTAYPLDPRGKIDLGNLMAPNEWQLAYAAAGLKIAKAGDYELRLSVDDPIKVWVDEVQVFEGRRLSDWQFDGVVLPLKLKAGAHRVLIKSAQAQGSWLLFARLTGPDASPLTPDAFTVMAADVPFNTGGVEHQGLEEGAQILRHLDGPPTTARRMMIAADWARRLGLHTAHVEVMEAFVTAYPESFRGRYELAMALWRNKERGRTSDILAALLEVSGDALPWLGMEQARFWRQQKLDVKARALLVKIRDMHPELPGPQRALAGLFAAEKWHEERCEALEIVDRLRPNWPGALMDLGDCYETQRFYPRAEIIYERLLKALPNHATLLRRLHWMAQGADDFERAVNYARRLTVGWPHQQRSWRILGETLRRAGDTAGAETAWRHLVEMAPSAAGGYVRLGRLARQDGRMAEAVALWKQALSHDPEDDRLANRLAYLAPEAEGPWAADVPDAKALAAAVAARDVVKAASGTDVLYLLDDEVTALGTDGSTINVVTLVAHAVNQAGRDHLTRVRVRGGGRSRIMHAFAVDRDGRRLEASSIRGNTVRFRQLSVGSTVVFQYRIDQGPDGYLAGHLARQFWYQGPAVQTHRGRWVLWVPKGTTLRSSLLGDVKAEKRDHGELLRYAWTGVDIPPLLPEPGMPPLGEIATHAVVSTVPSWEMFWQWEEALLRDAFRASPEMETLAAELFEGATTTREKVERLQGYLMTKIRYQQDYEHHIAGVKPHAAPVVMARQYGDCKDKAVLFITLARLAGVKVHFALVRTRDSGSVRRDLPMQQFNHAIVYVPAQPGFPEGRFYDPTVDALDVDVLRRDDQGTLALVFDPEGGSHSFIEIPFQAPEVDLTIAKTELDLDSEGAVTGTIKMTARGRVGATLRMAARNPETLARLLEQLVSQTYAGVRLKKPVLEQVTDVFKPAVVSFGLTAPHVGRREGRRLRVRVPIGWSPEQYFGLAKRRYPVNIGAPSTLRWEVALNIPPGAKIERLPGHGEVESACLVLRRRVRQTKGRVVVEQEVETRCHQIEPADYPAHRAAAQKMRLLIDQEMVLRVR